jgi:hypothetical protein
MKLTLHPKHGQRFESTKRFVVAVCGRRFGKTTVSLAKIISDAAANPNPIPQAFYWYIAPTFGQAKDIAWKMLNDLCDGWELTGETNETELTRYVNGIPIKLMGAENMPRLKGVALYGVVCDEYAEWKNGHIFWEAIMPTLQDTKGWAWIIGTPKGYNFFYELYEQGKVDNDFDVFHFTSYDNPLLDKKELDKAKERNPESFGQEYLANFTQVKGAVWKDFSRDIHVIPKYLPDGTYPIYGSIDFGFATGHATAFQMHEARPDQIRTFDGFTEYELDPIQLETMIERYTKGYQVRRIYCDSSRPDLIKLLNGIEADKDVELGIAKVAEYMRTDPLTNKPRWVICDHLREAIRQIENYQWDEYRGEAGVYKKAPLKRDDDNPDALRYFLYTFNKPDPKVDIQVQKMIQNIQTRGESW